MYQSNEKFKEIFFFLQTYKEGDSEDLKYDLHFWIGTQSTQVCISVLKCEKKTTDSKLHKAILSSDNMLCIIADKVSIVNCTR